MENITLNAQKPRWLICLVVLLCTHLQMHAQSVAVSGRVTSEEGETLPGVNVLESGTTNGVTTDSDGNYTIQVAGDAVLAFSFVGFQTIEIPVGNRSRIDVVLESDVRTLSEVVVIGYGTQRRETVTGSIATIQSDDFNPGVIMDPITLITGKVAGLAITRPNGADPNATVDFSLRGAVSREGSAQPLIVIDGVPGGDLRTIAPQDIESMDVLKDGSAAAIYGSRATGGVIIVTTKKGKEGPAKVTYNGYTSTDYVAKKYDVLNPDQFRALAQATGRPANDQGASTDWFEKLTRRPVSHGHNLSVSGGSGKTTYFTSLNFQDYEGMDLVSSRRFVNGTFRVNTKALSDKLDFSVMLTNSFDNKSFAEYWGFGQALNMNPTFPVYNADGTFFEAPHIAQGSQWNPVANTRYNTNRSKEKRMLGTANLAYSFTPALTGRLSYSYTFLDVLSGSYTDSRLQYMQSSGLLGQASRSQNNETNNVLEAMIDYQRQVGDHTFNVLGGYSYQNIFHEGFGAGNNNFNTNAFLYYNLGAGSALNNLQPGARRDGVFMNSFASERTLIAWFGRLIYDYQERYLLNASVRREGASVLGAANKWGTFAGVSAGWVLTKEDFMSGISGISSLKLRAGYGVTGNQNALSPYQSLATVGPFPWWTMHAYYGTPDDGSWVLSYGPTINPNESLRWETKKEVNAGLDFAMFNGSWLTGSIDYYDRRIEDLIGNFTAQLPPNIYPLIFANAGEMRNQGLEVLLDARLLNRKNFRWNATFVGARNKNEITSISSDQFFGSAQSITDVGLGWGQEVQRLAEGQPVNVFYGKVFAGFDENGQWLFRNKDGESVLSNQIGDDDFDYLGHSIPRWNLALTNTFTFGRFDASILLRSALDYNVLNAKRMFHDNINNFGVTNLFASELNWIPDPAYPTTGRPEAKHSGDQTFSSYYLEKGDYLKIDNVTIGYTFPFYNLRLYVTGMNLAVLTGFSGMDPELGINPYSQAGSSSGAGVEFNDNYYPRTRSFTVGISAQF